MFRHLLKPIWKRKSRNLMLSLEILLAFVVLFAITAVASRLFQLYQLPTGFSHANIWSVEIETPDHGELKNDPVLYDKYRRSLEALPEVEQVAFASFSPYQNAVWSTAVRRTDGGEPVQINTMQVSDEFFSALDMSVQEGRWFSAIDEGAAQQPAVINQRLAEALFPGRSAIGQLFTDGQPGSKDQQMYKVTGVIGDFRNRGEFMAPTPFLLTRFSPLSSKHGATSLLLKVKPGTGRQFEATLSAQLKNVRNDWSYRIAPLGDLRKALMSETVTPLIVLSVIAAFLLLMVAFGLFGVLWQNTTQRIPEIGLRRAIGATAGNIYRQIIAEQLLLTLLAVAVGLILLVQLPITGVLGENLGWPLFLASALVSTTVMALVSVLCALYPAWRASRMSPTEALHYE